MYITEKWKEIGDLNNTVFEISGKGIISNNGEMGKVRKVKIQIVLIWFLTPMKEPESSSFLTQSKGILLYFRSYYNWPG